MVTVVLVLQAPPVVYMIEAVPPAIPVTIPVEPTVAAAGDPELHTPPVTASVNAVVVPAQVVNVPVMGPGAWLTVNVSSATQPRSQ